MKIYEAKIMLYEEQEEDVVKFQKCFYDFVNAKREKGIAVTAKKMTQALLMFADNKYLDNFLKS